MRRGEANLLKISQLSKTFGRQTALNNISLSLDAGVVALLGANGSGKSTLLRILATLTTPDRGKISFDGHAYDADFRILRRLIGHLPQDLDLPGFMTPFRVLRYLAQLRNVSEAGIMPLLDAFDLPDRPLAQLSGGQVRFVGIIQAFMHNPALLLLDELTRGLDVYERAKVFRWVRGAETYRPRLTIFSTHIPEEAEQMADQIIVLHQGHLLYVGSIADMVTGMGAPSVEAAYMKLKA